MRENKRGITLIALIISIIVLVILAGVAINTLYGENGIITTTQDVAVLSNIKSLEESIDLYKIGKNLDGKVEEDSYPIALNEDGKIYTMSNSKNMSGIDKAVNSDRGDFTELTIKEGTTVKQVLTEDGFSLALLSNGEVYGWGYNTYGILGPNYEVGGIYPTPVKLEGLPANIRYMSLGNVFTIFASKSGEVYGIGKNDYGQLGTGDSIGRTEFVRCTKLEE